MTETLYDQARMMYQRQEYIKLRAFKKLKKKSWDTLGINAEMEARVMRSEIIGTNPRVAIIDEPIEKSMTYPMQHFVQADIGVLVYKHREIHAVLGTSSHPTIALIAQIKEQEKFRSDPRFSLFQIMQRVKRYKAIFAGRSYLPIFS